MIAGGGGQTSHGRRIVQLRVQRDRFFHYPFGVGIGAHGAFDETQSRGELAVDHRLDFANADQRVGKFRINGQCVHQQSFRFPGRGHGVGRFHLQHRLHVEGAR